MLNFLSTIAKYNWLIYCIMHLIFLSFLCTAGHCLALQKPFLSLKMEPVTEQYIWIPENLVLEGQY